MSEAIAGLIGALVGFVASFLTLRFNYKQLFAETVSSNRMEWINVWRENISKFLACAEAIGYMQSKNVKKSCDSFCKNDDKEFEYTKEFYQSRAMIVSRLNLTEELHKAMHIAIYEVNLTNLGNFSQQRELILQIARQILKPEWERVKNEARGKGE